MGEYDDEGPCMHIQVRMRHMSKRHMNKGKRETTKKQVQFTYEAHAGGRKKRKTEKEKGENDTETQPSHEKTNLVVSLQLVMGSMESNKNQHGPMAGKRQHLHVTNTAR